MMNMLSYVKLILEKVSFDRGLFEKELKKGIKVLNPTELGDLRKWCYEKFGKLYLSILNNVFKRPILDY